MCFDFANPGGNEEGTARSRREMGRLRKRKGERTEGETERKRVEERQKRKTILHISAVRPLAWLTIEKPVCRTDGKSAAGALGDQGV